MNNEFVLGRIASSAERIAESLERIVHLMETEPINVKIPNLHPSVTLEELKIQSGEWDPKQGAEG